MKKLIIVSLLLILFAGNASSWYNNDWNYRIPVEINNTGNNAINYYQFNVSFSSGINATSIRVVNDSTDTVVPHWCQNITDGLCYELWFNTSVANEINNDYYIYYGNDVVASTSNYNNTFTKKYNNTGLVLELSMDEGTGFSQTNDTSGEGNHGTFTNMNATGNTTSGWQGTDGGQWDNRSDMIFSTGDQLQFDGSNDYINIPDSNSLDIIDSITISSWIKRNVFDIRHVILAKYDAITGERTYAFDINTNYLTLYLGNATGGSALGTTASKTLIQDDTWYHVVSTWDKNGVDQNVHLFVNGIEETYATQATKTDIFVNSSIDVLIGNRKGTSRYFNGFIDEVRIYNRALSKEEIYRQYIRSKYTADVPILTIGSEEVPAYTNISLYSKSPETLFTNYTGLLSASYIVESNFPLNMSSLAFLIGMNYTLTSDYHSYLKVPPNTIADDGIYRAHNRNTTPYLSWEGNNTITEGNVWKWSGGEYGDFWITNTSINSTHTWINMTGVASNVFPSMFYLGRSAAYASEKTGVEINRVQGVIFKIWDLEQFRGRSYDYYLSLYFDSQIESIPNENIEIWYCNDSFDPLTDDPCDVCDYKDTWSSDRWMDHEAWQPHSNVSYAKPLQVHAGTATCPSSPTETNYIYLKSNTVSSKSYILNATNADPGICNLTFGQTNTMWLRNEIAGTNTPHAYTPSFFNTFIRDYLEFTHHMYIANDQDVWGHSDYTTHPIGISNVNPTFCKYNYFWWNGTTDYNMNGSYTEDFNINLTYGFDPDNGAALTHVLSLYDEDYNFVAFINSSLIGNQTDVDVYFYLESYISLYSSDKYRFKIVSTDNEGSTSVSWSNLFSIPLQSKYKNVAAVIRAFPATLQHTLTTLLSYIPLLVGGLIAGVLIILVMNVFGKLKRW